jgi:hypothetical protein
MDFWTGKSAGTIDVLKDQTPFVSAYFNSMRLPATFMTTQALNALFKLKVNKEDEAENSEVTKLLVQMTQFFIMVAFLTAITSVVSGTAASVKMLHGGFDPVAPTPYDLLVRHFEFEFLSVRWTFLMSIFCFLIGVGTQGIVQFHLLENKQLLAIFVGTLLSVTSFLVSYVNNNIFDYGSLIGMTTHFLAVRSCNNRKLLLLANFVGLGLTIIRSQLIFLDIQKAEPMVIMFMVSSIVTGLLFVQRILKPLLKLLSSKSSTADDSKSRTPQGSKWYARP